MLAPICPFVSEQIFQNLKLDSKLESFESVHLATFPLAEEEIDLELEEAFSLFEDVIVLGRTIRNKEGVKLRQPISKLTIVHASQKQLDGLKQLETYLKDELNVKNVIYTNQEEEFVNLNAKLNTVKHGKTLGPKLGKDGMKELHQAIRQLSTEELRDIEQGSSTLDYRDLKLGSEDILINRAPKKGLKACSSSGQVTISLDLELTKELKDEGIAREFVNRVQKLRKDYNFVVADRILLKFMTACPIIALSLIHI